MRVPRKKRSRTLVPGSPSSKSETTSKLSLYTFVPSISKRICQIHSVKISMTQSRKQECKKIGGYETSPFCIKPDLQAGDPRTHFLTVTALSTACCRIVFHLKAKQCPLNNNHLDSQLSGRDICKNTETTNHFKGDSNPHPFWPDNISISGRTNFAQQRNGNLARIFHVRHRINANDSLRQHTSSYVKIKRALIVP